MLIWPKDPQHNEVEKCAQSKRRDKKSSESFYRLMMMLMPMLLLYKCLLPSKIIYN